MIYPRGARNITRGKSTINFRPQPRYLPPPITGRSSFRSRHVNSPAFLIDNRVSQRPFPLTIRWTNGIGNERRPPGSGRCPPPPLFPPSPSALFFSTLLSSFSSCRAEVFYRLRSIGFPPRGGKRVHGFSSSPFLTRFHFFARKSIVHPTETMRNDESGETVRQVLGCIIGIALQL